MNSWVLLVVVVVVVVVNRVSGPVSGIGSTRSIFWGAFGLFLCVFQQFWQSRVNKNTINVRGSTGP